MRGVSHKAVSVPPTAGEVLGGLSMAESPGAPFTGDVLRKQAHIPPGTEAAELGLLGEVTNSRPGGGGNGWREEAPGSLGGSRDWLGSPEPRSMVQGHVCVWLAVG